ncbi:hypothetical protein SCP_1002890 [Sparassis crispa]|uniref:C2H2-type domain-containing protein n=1 Tax=Sparassis crispa TaxID=139825 RepID=A0A401GXX0_9APHY|nr:hypothetical protein SCP_1002890 [Sparassis crispa]GBE87042.1 hypothetical protein SCP_1002890 [Sparassis crispa]
MLQWIAGTAHMIMRIKRRLVSNLSVSSRTALTLVTGAFTGSDDEYYAQGNRRCGVRLFQDPYNPDSEAMKFPCPFPGCTYRTLQAGNLKPHSLKQCVLAPTVHQSLLSLTDPDATAQLRCGPSMSDSVNVYGAFIGDSIDFFVPSASLELLEGHPTDVFYGSHTAQDLSNHSAVPSQVNGKLKESYCTLAYISRAGFSTENFQNQGDFVGVGDPNRAS